MTWQVFLNMFISLINFGRGASRHGNRGRSDSGRGDGWGDDSRATLSSNDIWCRQAGNLFISLIHRLINTTVGTDYTFLSHNALTRQEVRMLNNKSMKQKPFEQVP